MVSHGTHSGLGPLHGRIGVVTGGAGAIGTAASAKIMADSAAKVVQTWVQRTSDTDGDFAYRRIMTAHAAQLTKVRAVVDAVRAVANYCP